MTTRQYDKSERVELADEAVHWDLGSSLSYGQYLQLDKLLDAQRPLTGEHNEMLFVIVHQVSELWMRLMLHELTAAMSCVRRDDLDPALKMLARIARSQNQLIAVWDVLSTMTPFEYTAFRNALGRSSGFQSVQYRLLEFLFGNKNADMTTVHKRDPEAYALLERALAEPSLYDEVLRLLSRRGYEVPQDHLLRDFREPYVASKQVAGAWLGVYHNADKDWDLYELAEKLV
ncbi:MAG TPA: tryptophan 2,3-dioxygenase family protein, partial [Steroidobacteraceae bacterium]|nr:tryptophan 2,3-dioxygenase family protein [Steroidobacteraceae bacterium]